MEKVQWLNVNQLSQAIAVYLGAKSVHIRMAVCGDIVQQHKPKEIMVGVGGVLSVEVAVEE